MSAVLWQRKRLTQTININIDMLIYVFQKAIQSMYILCRYVGLQELR